VSRAEFNRERGSRGTAKTGGISQIKKPKRNREVCPVKKLGIGDIGRVPEQKMAVQKRERGEK